MGRCSVFRMSSMCSEGIGRRSLFLRWVSANCVTFASIGLTQTAGPNSLNHPKSGTSTRYLERKKLRDYPTALSQIQRAQLNGDLNL